MSSEFLCNNNGAGVAPSTSPSSRSKLSQAAGINGTHDACPSQRFDNLTLDELSAELDRRTKETQRLQDEVENATKVALQKFGCTYSVHSSPEQSCDRHSLNVYDDPGESSIPPTKQHAVTQPLVCDLDNLNQTEKRVNCPPREDVFENVVDDCPQQLSDLQLSKKLTQQEEVSVDTIVNLQTELHKVQMEKDALSDLRLKDSKTHVVQMEKMLCMLEELQVIKKAGDQKLQETEDETLSLNRKTEILEKNVKEMYRLLFHEDPALSQGRPWSEKRSGALNQNEGIEDLIANVCQEMELLTNKLCSSKDNSVNLSVKLELLRKLAERQTSLHQCQLRELESNFISHKDQVHYLEQQLIQAQSQLVDAQREKERSLSQAEELQSQVYQIKMCGEQHQWELQGEVKILRGQLEASREELCRAEREKICQEAQLKKRAQEGKKSQELLEETTKELHLVKQESQQYLSRLEEAQRQCQALRAEGETLRLRLDDQERMIDVLKLQMESSIQMTVQHNRTIDNLHQENSLISNQHKQQVQQLRAELEQNKSELAAVEQEKRQLQASVTEQSQQVQEETLKKQQLTSQLEIQCMQFLTLTEEHKQLQQLHICKSKEHEGAVLKLQSQLMNTQNELDQVKSTLRTVEGADGHGLKVATEMQKKITAKREQIDSLQGKIQHLEETMEKLLQEKRQQSLQHQQQLQELTFIREEKRQLRSELEALRSKDKQLRERISQMEAFLHKISESFANCQDFIQLQEQEFYRLKLKHALDLKELQGQHFKAITELESPSPSELIAPPSSQHACNTHITQKEEAVREFRSLVKELRGVISENNRPHTENTITHSSVYRRRSAPEREHRSTFTDKAEEIKTATRFRRKTCGSEAHGLRTTEKNGMRISSKPYNESCVILSSATAGRYLFSPHLLSPGRRSPVHSLLTSNPNNQQLPT